MTRKGQKRKKPIQQPQVEEPATPRIYPDDAYVTWDDEDAETSENMTYKGLVKGATYYAGTWVYMVETAKDTFQIVLEEELALVQQD